MYCIIIYYNIYIVLEYMEYIYFIIYVLILPPH